MASFCAHAVCLMARHLHDVSPALTSLSFLLTLTFKAIYTEPHLQRLQFWPTAACTRREPAVSQAPWPPSLHWSHNCLFICESTKYFPHNLILFSPMSCSLFVWLPHPMHFSPVSSSPTHWVTVWPMVWLSADLYLYLTVCLIQTGFDSFIQYLLECLQVWTLALDAVRI